MQGTGEVLTVEPIKKQGNAASKAIELVGVEQWLSCERKTSACLKGV
jgi:hypothetical protein